MKRLVTNERARVGAWVAEKVGRDHPWVHEAALGLEQDGELVGGIVLSDYVPHARASMHCAGKGKTWLNRTFLFACFDYAFNFLDLKVLINTAAADNEASLRFMKHIGFREISHIPQAWDGTKDLVLFELRRDECKWIKPGGKHENLH